jgi:hypothetical protein
MAAALPATCWWPGTNHWVREETDDWNHPLGHAVTMPERGKDAYKVTNSSENFQLQVEIISCSDIELYFLFTTNEPPAELDQTPEMVIFSKARP